MSDSRKPSSCLSLSCSQQGRYKRNRLTLERDRGLQIVCRREPLLSPLWEKGVEPKVKIERHIKKEHEINYSSVSPDDPAGAQALYFLIINKIFTKCHRYLFSPNTSTLLTILFQHLSFISGIEFFQVCINRIKSNCSGKDRLLWGTKIVTCICSFSPGE